MQSVSERPSSFVASCFICLNHHLSMQYNRRVITMESNQVSAPGRSGLEGEKLIMATSAVNVQAVAAKGSAAAGNNNNANLLVLVTDPSTGAGVTSLIQADLSVIDQFSLPGQSCGFSSNVTSFNNVGTGAYQLTIATHSVKPPVGGCKWVAGNYLGQVIVKTAAVQGQAAFLLSI